MDHCFLVLLTHNLQRCNRFATEDGVSRMAEVDLAFELDWAGTKDSERAALLIFHTRFDNDHA